MRGGGGGPLRAINKSVFVRWMPFEFAGNPSGPDPGGDKIYIERIIQRIRLTRRILQRFVSADSCPGSVPLRTRWPGGRGGNDCQAICVLRSKVSNKQNIVIVTQDPRFRVFKQIK